MSSQPPSEGPDRPSFAQENAMRVAAESLTHYDEASDTYHCSYGIPQPALAVLDPERELIVRVDRHTYKVVGFSIPNFRAWHAAHAEPDGQFEVELPSVWPLGDEESPAEG